MQILQIVNKINNFILDTLFPVACEGCSSKNNILCDGCLLKIKLAERETQENIIAVFDYRDLLIKKLIWNLKYHNQKYLCKRLGQILFDYTKEEISGLKVFSSGKPVVVVPVPMSKIRLRERGYNQSELLAFSFCQNDFQNLEYNKNIIFKKQETEHQAKISNKKTRGENIKNTFSVNPDENITGRTIVIIDDVTTTGSTMLEIMRTLKKAGAKKIVGVALAH